MFSTLAYLLAFSACYSNTTEKESEDTANTEDSGSIEESDTGEETDTGDVTDTGDETDTGEDTTDSRIQLRYRSHHRDHKQTIDAIIDCDILSGRLEIIEQSWLTELNLPNLTEITGYLSITWNENLIGINLPQLTTAHNSVGIAWNAGLTELSFPMLQSTQSINIAYNTRLITIDGLQALTLGKISMGPQTYSSPATRHSTTSTVSPTSPRWAAASGSKTTPP